MPRLYSKSGFTLNEILIVLAILSILGVIAVRQYTSATTASKTAEVREILKMTAMGLETYKVDAGVYPYDGYTSGGPGLPGQGFWYLGPSITTPVAYLPTADINDPFRADSPSASLPPTADLWYWDNIRYTNIHSTWGTHFSSISGHAVESVYYDEVQNGYGGWRLVCGGPDGTYGPTDWDGVPSYPPAAQVTPYDPTNGLMSQGDILRTQKYEHGYYNVP